MLYLVDLDEVTVDFLSGVCREHNRITGDNLRPGDITAWELGKFNVSEESWQKPGFFYDLKPFKGAVEALWKMHKWGNRLWVVTNSQGIDFIEEDKAAWVREYIPFVRGIVFTDKKHEIPGDVMIDDCPEYLEKYPGTTIKIRRPYNEGVLADYEFDSLAEVGKAVC